MGLLGRGREAVSQSLIERFYMTSRPPYWISKQSNDGDFSVPNRSCGSRTWLSSFPINLKRVKTAYISACATTGFPAKWRRSLRNKRENSILMTCRFPNLVNASDWLCRVGNFLPPIRSTIQIWVVWNFYACSSEVISRWNHWWCLGMSAVFSGIAAGHVKENAPYGSVIVIWMF